MSGAVVATLGRSVIYQSDLELVHPGQWFNDSLIHYAFEILSDELGPEAPLILVPPQAAFVLLHEEDDDDFCDTVVGVFRSAPAPSANATSAMSSAASPAARFRSCAALFPLNNSAARQGTSSGGDHWTALLWLPARREFLFLDSHAGAARRGGAGPRDAHRAAVDALARRVARALHSSTDAAGATRVFGVSEAAVSAAEDEEAVVTADEVTVVDAAFAAAARLPQQDNSSDCGPFVVQWARVLAAAVAGAAADAAPGSATATAGAAPGVAALTAAAILPELMRAATGADAAGVRGWLEKRIRGPGAA